MSETTATSIQNDLELVTGLLTIGVWKISDSPDSYEAIIMRTAWQVLNNLHLYVGKQRGKQSATRT